MNKPHFTPANEQEARQWVLQAHADGTHWMPVGNRSRPFLLAAGYTLDDGAGGANASAGASASGGANDSGATHQSPAATISTAAMRAIHWIDPEDRTCEVDAGLPVADLATAIAEHGLMLGHSSLSGTVGGLLNSGEPSLLAGSCGLPRDQVLGATWLLPDGRVIRSGARVVKSVAGYDVTRLLLSAQGQLAMCLRLILRLRPLPQDLRWYRMPQELQRPAASWKPWCDFAVAENRYAAWEGCQSPLQDAVWLDSQPSAADIPTADGTSPLHQARSQAAQAVQWVATATPWSRQQMRADGKDLSACLLVDNLGLQSAWTRKQTMASLPAGSAVLPHQQPSPWLKPMREALLKPASLA